MRRTVLIVTALLVVAAASFHEATRPPALRRVDVPVPGLAREVRLVQVSDLQSARFGREQAGIADILRGRRLSAHAPTSRSRTSS